MGLNNFDRFKMKFIAVFCLFFAVGTLAAPLEVWSDCSKSGDTAKINSITLNPDPPVKGKSLTISPDITLSKDISAGSIEVQVHYGIIPITKKLDLCTVLGATPAPCPVKAGHYNAPLSVDIPADIPEGHYKVQVTITDQDSSEVACLSLDLHF